MAVGFALVLSACGAQVGGEEDSSDQALSSCAGLNVPIHERVRTSDGAAVLTASVDEDQLLATRYGYDDGRGVVFLAASKASAGLTPVYRLFNPDNGDHFFTTSASERDAAKTHYGYTRDEGTPFYASSTSAPCATPVYRFLSPANFTKAKHRFAVTYAERKTLAAAGWQSEGIHFFAVAPGGTEPVSTRPTGPNTVRYEDVYRAGMTLQQVVTAAGNKLLTFPTGTFEFNDFKSVDNAGITFPPGSLGIAGSGRGTVFRMKAHTSTKTAPTTGTNPLYLMRFSECTAQPTLSDFQLQGTDQGHPYGGIMLRECPHVTVQDLYLLGASPGYANGPPGETFGINFFRSGHASLVDTEIDGRDVTGKRVCASPFGWNSGTDALIENGYFHHSLSGHPTFWETNGITSYNLRSEYNGSGPGSLSGHGINHERSTNIVHHNPTVIVDHQHGNTGTHISFNNDQANSTMTIIDPTWDDSGVDNGELVISTSPNYQGGHQKQTTPPTVESDSGKGMTYFWIH